MKKFLFLFMAISMVFIGGVAAKADTGNERVWYFNEGGFALNKTTVLTEEETISGLTYFTYNVFNQLLQHKKEKRY